MFASRGFNRAAWNLLILFIDPTLNSQASPHSYFLSLQIENLLAFFFFFLRFLTCTLFLWFRIKLRLVVLLPSSLGGLSPSQGTHCLESVTQKLTRRSQHFSNFGMEQSQPYYSSYETMLFKLCLSLS